MTRGHSGGFPPARKSLGQHFLRDRSILVRIAEATGVTGDDRIIEIGPGRGALTDVLAERAGHVFAIELDRALAAMLRERYADEPRVTIVEADVLAVELASLAGNDFLLVGNVPYYITTPIVFHALRPPRPRRAVFLVQREVADRMAAIPGGREYGALSANVQALAQVEIVLRVPPGAFSPPPKVESAVVRLAPRAEPTVEPALEDRFRTFVIEAFGVRRKQMRRVLRTITGVDATEADALLEAASIDPAARPETLAPHDFARLVRLVAEQEGERGPH